MRGQTRLTEATPRTCCAKCAWRCSRPMSRCGGARLIGAGARARSGEDVARQPDARAALVGVVHKELARLMGCRPPAHNGALLAVQPPAVVCCRLQGPARPPPAAAGADADTSARKGLTVSTTCPAGRHRAVADLSGAARREFFAPMLRCPRSASPASAGVRRRHYLTCWLATARVHQNREPMMQEIAQLHAELAPVETLSWSTRCSARTR